MLLTMFDVIKLYKLDKESSYHSHISEFSKVVVAAVIQDLKLKIKYIQFLMWIISVVPFQKIQWNRILFC